LNDGKYAAIRDRVPLIGDRFRNAIICVMGHAPPTEYLQTKMAAAAKKEDDAAAAAAAAAKKKKSASSSPPSVAADNKDKTTSRTGGKMWRPDNDKDVSRLPPMVDGCMRLTAMEHVVLFKRRSALSSYRTPVVYAAMYPVEGGK